VDIVYNVRLTVQRIYIRQYNKCNIEISVLIVLYAYRDTLIDLTHLILPTVPLDSTTQLHVPAPKKVHPPPVRAVSTVPQEPSYPPTGVSVLRPRPLQEHPKPTKNTALYPTDSTLYCPLRLHQLHRIPTIQTYKDACSFSCPSNPGQQPPQPSQAHQQPPPPPTTTTTTTTTTKSQLTSIYTLSYTLLQSSLNHHDPYNILTLLESDI
jgi:hypothetical protein